MNKNLTLYFCGNGLINRDNMPFRVLPLLKGEFGDVEFKEFDPTENFPQGDPVYIIDTVLGLERPAVLGSQEIERLEDAPHVSVHDADLTFHLKWLKKMGTLPRVVIFGVPAEGDEKAVAGDLAKLIKKTVG
jgi:hypothetical protein